MFRRIAFVGLIFLVLFSFEPVISQSALFFDGDRRLQKLNQPLDDELQQWLDFLKQLLPAHCYVNHFDKRQVYSLQLAEGSSEK